MINNLEQIVQLAQLTGDRLIVADSQNIANSLVILSLADYQELLTKTGLTKKSSSGKVEDNLTSPEAGNVNVKSNFIEKVEGVKKSPWAIPASRQVASTNNSEDDN